MNYNDEAGFFAKMKAPGRSTLKVHPRSAILAGIGGFVTIGILSFLTSWTSSEWLMAPFGASCVLAFGLWDAPLSQPRNIIGGHFISTLTGLIMYHLFGNSNWVIAASVGLSILVMMLTKTTHPPAGANPLAIMLGGTGWSFLFMPVLTGSFLIVLVALVINNLDKSRRYPTFWY
ncbi:HPP family protein [Paenibacillus sp. JJ-223]|uniref:HPP family protein n=1 Tax=Paenibacillus sp. JJ-223 TaxID=2905647 RepID=UPI001F392021|nr:HPP family protein [Paenibacillus sp. JJ-223]CAH1198675.1 hypothetical protein PAECIP111890_01303 [Paenibacillus sp. JJ-223]